MKGRKGNSHRDISKSTIKSSGTGNRDVKTFRYVGYINKSVLALWTSDKFQPDIL